MDLVALNIQRGRDHGLPGYNSYRRACGMQPVRSFRELDQIMQPGSAQVLSQLYRNVDDIDLFIGGCHERPLPEAILGPTFACIVAEQARRTKHGDRFWYENGGLPHSFNESKSHHRAFTQIEIIKKQNKNCRISKIKTVKNKITVLSKIKTSYENGRS